MPVNPRTGRLGAVDDPGTWATFGEALAAVASGRYAHLGYVFAHWDPFFVIDWDDKLTNPATPEDKELLDSILARFQTYTERSASGRGLHLYGIGRFEGSGVHTGRVEVYCRARFMVVTGNVERDLPLVDCQDMLVRLVEALRPNGAPVNGVELTEHEEIIDDRELVEMAMRAVNADKFTQLCNGEWGQMTDADGRRLYPSQSEADHALLAMLCFYSKSNAQVRRLFRYSALGKREKAVKDNVYLDRSIAKIRAGEPPPVDLSALEARVVAATRAGLEAVEAAELPPPPGLVGDIARYIYNSAIKPVPEVALAAGLGLVAGIAGRQFNTVTDAQLNLYLVVLGGTGVGKEGAKDGIERLIQAVREAKYPTADSFLGPTNFASGQALVRRLDSQPCLVSTIGEFGKLLRRLTSPKASAAELSLVSVLLDLYSRRKLRESAYSDHEKNTAIVDAPSFTFIGDSTPEVFFKCLTEATIADGFVPRFLVMEYAGLRMPTNKAAGAPPPRELVVRLGELVSSVEQMRSSNRFVRVPLTPPAAGLLDAFDARVDKIINDGKQEVVRQAWNRAHLNALRVASLLAVGSPEQKVTQEHAHWAIAFVERSVETILSRFASGEVGGSEESQAEAVVRKKVAAFLAMTPAERRKNKTARAFETGPFIPYSYLNETTKRDAAFHKEDMLGRVLKLLVKSGDLVKLTDQQCTDQFKGWRGTEVYALGPSWDDKG